MHVIVFIFLPPCFPFGFKKLAVRPIVENYREGSVTPELQKNKKFLCLRTILQLYPAAVVALEGGGR